MRFKDFHQKHKKTFNYISKVMTRACIVILVIIAIFFVIYFVESFIAKSKGQKYVPRFSLFTIISPSMAPSINVYDIVFDVKIGDFSKIKKGDVITFYSTGAATAGMTITHRVTRAIKTDSGYEFVTKGDNNLFEDGATAKSSDIIGKVLFKIPQLGRIQFFLYKPIGWICCILLPALAIIGYDLVKLFKVLKMNDKSKQIALAPEEAKKTAEEIKMQILANKEAIINNISPEVNQEIPKEKEENVMTSNEPSDLTDDLPKLDEKYEENLEDSELPKLK